MSPKEDPEQDEGAVEGKIRRGQLVIRTTLELEKDLYLKLKEEVARSNTSMRDFLTRAASERLRGSRDVRDASRTSANLLLDSILRNRFARKVLDTIETELAPPFSQAVLISKAMKYDIELNDLSAATLTDELIDDICRSVGFVSESGAAADLKKALIGLRRV